MFSSSRPPRYITTLVRSDTLIEAKLAYVAPTMPGKSNKELEEEHKKIEHKPEDLKDTDAENEYKEGGKPGFRQNTGVRGPSRGVEALSGSSTSSTGRPSNEQLERDQKKTEMKPEDLKDTDADDEYKEDGKPGFRKQSTKARL